MIQAIAPIDALNTIQFTGLLSADVGSLIIKIAVLTVLFLYVVYALAFFVQTRRTETWLLTLQAYYFPRYALLHLILAAGGWVLALLIL